MITDPSTVPTKMAKLLLRTSGRRGSYPSTSFGCGWGTDSRTYSQPFRLNHVVRYRRRFASTVYAISYLTAVLPLFNPSECEHRTVKRQYKSIGVIFSQVSFSELKSTRRSFFFFDCITAHSPFAPPVLLSARTFFHQPAVLAVAATARIHNRCRCLAISAIHLFRASLPSSVVARGKVSDVQIQSMILWNTLFPISSWDSSSKWPETPSICG